MSTTSRSNGMRVAHALERLGGLVAQAAVGLRVESQSSAWRSAGARPRSLIPARQAALRAKASNARNSGYGTAARTSPRTRSSPRCPCKARAAGSSARGRARRTAPPRARAGASWPPRRPRSPAGGAPVRSSACSSLTIRDSTTARSNDAARSARRASVCVRAELPHLVDERGLQPAEAEVERVAAAHPDREVERLRVALARQAVDRGAARDSRGPSGARALSSASPAASSRVEPSSS